MNDTLRKAVELADDVWPWDYHKKETVLEFSQYDLDALAAQLVRQVDALPNLHVSTVSRGSAVHENVRVSGEEAYRCLGSCDGPDRAMNSINCIVDSGVLE